MSVERYNYLSFLRQKINELDESYKQAMLKYLHDEKTLESFEKQSQYLQGAVAYIRRIRSEWLLYSKRTQ